jgi:hypothetical protein
MLGGVARLGGGLMRPWRPGGEDGWRHRAGWRRAHVVAAAHGGDGW